MPVHSVAADEVQIGFGTFKLLEGFEHKRLQGIDSLCGKLIGREGRFVIHYSSGPYSRQAGPKNRDTFAWYREQQIGSRTICAGILEPTKESNDLRTIIVSIHGTAKERKRPSESPLSFRATIRNDADVGDVLMTVWSFDPDGTPTPTGKKLPGPGPPPALVPNKNPSKSKS